MYKVLVTGATGFIGGHIAKKALDVGWRVSGFRRNPGSVGHLQNLHINWINGNLDDYPSLLSAMSGMDYVFHAAGFYPSDGNPAHVTRHVQAATGQMKNVIRATR
ncbi:MAG: NAD-dependent epimerase/dehydratase family protein, partial [Anaerolineales bacterium]|nr:NAD-dependent epimerase/dehydratase family protein [Anaerolineales bacterium]